MPQAALKPAPSGPKTRAETMNAALRRAAIIVWPPHAATIVASAHHSAAASKQRSDSRVCPPMHTLSARDHREMDRLTPLLVAACRRDAPTTLAAADILPFGEREVRAQLLDLASRHGVLGLVLATFQ